MYRGMRQNVNDLVSRVALKLNGVDSVQRVAGPLRYLFDLAAVSLAGVTNAAKDGLRNPVRVALLSDRRVPTSEEQFNPFSSHRRELREQLSLVSVHLLLKDVLRFPWIVKPFDVAILKLSFRTNPSEALRVVRVVRSAFEGGRLIYFDGDDDLSVLWPKMLPDVDLYVKKHLFRDRRQYQRQFVGKSNLTDFVHRQYGYSFAQDPVAAETIPVAEDQLFKIKVGCNLATDRSIFKLYKEGSADAIGGGRENDVVFRGSVPKDWSYYLRKDIEPALRRLEKSFKVILPTRRVAADDYYREMRTSKICISPFGYGEICWRDFEAILCGCLLVKPDMSHVETNPDIFIGHQTYVPVKWDFSDLEEKCSFYLEHEGERQRIVDQAFCVLEAFYRGEGVIKAFGGLFQSVSD
jgi:hypothetical protein